MKHLIKLAVICTVILALVTYLFYSPEYYDGDNVLRESFEKGLGGGLAFAGFALLIFSVGNIAMVSTALHNSTMSTIVKRDAATTTFMQGGQSTQFLPNADLKKRSPLMYKNMNKQMSGLAIALPFIFTVCTFIASGWILSASGFLGYR